MAAELKAQLDRANTPEKRVKVVRSCVNLVTVSASTLGSSMPTWFEPSLPKCAGQ